MQEDKYYMNIALLEAKKAFRKEEVPIGAVVVKNNKVIAKAYNRKTLDNVATYHAEILAIEKACRKLKTWYLEDCVLYTTVEPCLMCTGAIMQSRIPKVVYGTNNEAFGHLSKLTDSKIEIVSDVLKDDCKQILTDFFKKQRIKNDRVQIKFNK